jgi:hypothetical protein
MNSISMEFRLVRGEEKTEYAHAETKNPRAAIAILRQIEPRVDEK